MAYSENHYTSSNRKEIIKEIHISVAKKPCISVPTLKKVRTAIDRLEMEELKTTLRQKTNEKQHELIE